MPITVKVFNILLANSAGFCQNPECNKYIFSLFEDGDINNLEETAHIIAKNEKGPRGESGIDKTKRDEFENLIILCPTCHTIVDKNPTHYPVEMLHNWKDEHINRIHNLFSVPLYSNRVELHNEVQRLLRRNRILFRDFGPFSFAANSLLTDAATYWNKIAKPEIIKNNRRLHEVLLANFDFLNETEKELFEKFSIHITGFELNHINKDKYPSAPIFPEGMEHILED